MKHQREHFDAGLSRGKNAEDEVVRKEETGRPKMRFMDVVKEDMAEVEVTEEDTEDIGITGDEKSAVATPDGKSRKKKKNMLNMRGVCCVCAWHTFAKVVSLFSVQKINCMHKMLP